MLAPSSRKPVAVEHELGAGRLLACTSGPRSQPGCPQTREVFDALCVDDLPAGAHLVDHGGVWG
jgi:hypothetical protein